MRIHIIACRVLSRELSALAAVSPHVVDLSWLPQGLHDTPDLLRQSVRDTIAHLESDVSRNILKHRPDYIALGYGLCSNGVVGIESSDIPIIVPKTDDCIALFLGSQARYMQLFDEYPGTFWLNNGWMESCYGMQGEWWTKPEERLAEYIEKYGEDNAEYLLEQETAWIVNYRHCFFIQSPTYHNAAYAQDAGRVASNNEWTFDSTQGDNRLLRMLTEGTWTEEECLICPPHHRIEAAYDGTKLKAVPL